jgi:hypothetical protein
MGCILAYIAMTIGGIIAVAKGKITIVAGREVRGLPAYLIGALLIGTFPIIFVSAFTAGVVMALTGNL